VSPAEAFMARPPNENRTAASARRKNGIATALNGSARRDNGAIG
jgi:hypothetical protein